jgi:hypothetical protein
MKKYLFGLGAMLVGAGLMFVLMHGEVKAEPSDKELEVYCEATTVKQPNLETRAYRVGGVTYCKIKDLTCVFTQNLIGKAVSCVKS